MFYKSIRFRFILWYTVAMTVTLVVFSVALYREMKSVLTAHMDTVLKSRAIGVKTSIDTYWDSERLQTENEGSFIKVFGKINELNFIKVAQSWIQRPTDPDQLSTIVQIFDSNGDEVAVPENFPSRALFTPDILACAQAGKERFDQKIIAQAAGAPMSLRVYTTPVFEGDMVLYIVQVARPMSLVDSAVENLFRIMTLLVPLTSLSTALFGFFLARLTLNPVAQMIQSIHQITEDNLRRRVVEPDTHDEVQRMAQTFNGLLDRLEKAFTSQRQLLQDISHELKTPLTILKGELEVTLKKIRSAREYETILCSSLEEIERMHRLIESLLLLSKLESTETLPHMDRLNLGELVTMAVSDIRPLADQKQIRMSVTAPEEAWITGNDTQIRHLFLSLLDNAVKYTPESGSVTVTVDPAGPREVCVRVADTGVGIPPEEMPHIFQRFYQVDKSRSSRGFGLGLSIVNSIVQAHRGRIDVQSSVDVGTVFTVSLPV